MFLIITFLCLININFLLYFLITLMKQFFLSLILIKFRYILINTLQLLKILLQQLK